MPMRRLVNIAYAMAVEGLDKKNRKRLNDELNTPDVEVRHPEVRVPGAARQPPSWWKGEDEAYRSGMAVQSWMREQRT